MASTRPVRPGGTARLYQVVAQQLAEMIQANAADEGWRVPSERELAEQLGVSRPVVREAIIALEMRGLVEVRGRTGIIVLEPHGGRVSFEAADDGPGPFELLEARLAIESSAAAMAAEKATSADIAILEACIEQMQGERDVRLLNEQGDRDFHLNIARMSGNAIILSMIETLWVQRDQSAMWRKLHEFIHAPDVRPLWIGDHHAVLAAIRLRSADGAYKAMARHIRNVIEELLEADERAHLAVAIAPRRPF
ncbi:MAG: GntR family transcriptional regulator protein [Devosia sp.]|jgi:GntR family uxuAB operon transcriptional repressor|nr:GntR family transcriptional regulator protein [Devosia sp.]